MAVARKFSLLQTALGAGVINAVLNAPLAFVFVREGAALPLFGLPGIAADLVGMAYGIAFGTGLVVTLQTRSALRRGRLLLPELSERVRASLERWPPSALRRGINLGVLSILFFVPLPLLALYVLGVHGLDRSALIWFKGSFSFVEGALVTPIVVIAAGVPTE